MHREPHPMLDGKQDDFMLWLKEQPDDRVIRVTAVGECALSCYLRDKGAPGPSCGYFVIRADKDSDDYTVPDWGRAVQDRLWIWLRSHGNDDNDPMTMMQVREALGV